jgi:hypothetical protein
MKFERDDLLFEEAGRDGEKLDLLLLRSKKERKVAGRILISVICLLLLALAGLLYEVGRIVNAFWNFSKHHGPFPEPPPEFMAAATFFNKPTGAAMGLGCFFIAFSYLLGVSIAFRVADQRVKTLLLLRGFREARPQRKMP